MTELIQAVTASIAAFTATNIDDIVILMVFFSRISPTFRPHHVVVGQYLGFLLLLLASLPGFLGGLIIPPVWLGLLGFLPIAIGIHQLFAGEADATDVQTVTEENSAKNGWLGRSRSFLNIPPQTYQVAAVTVANGGDNISIYVPLFANSTLAAMGVILSVFLVMVAVWCGIAYYLTRHAAIAHYLTHYGHRVVPFVLIGLGIFILLESRVYQLLILS
ncbi:MAG TPA: cadmium resistance transporter [Candidatus Sericytochromatia bacterium]|jgi:cadmium resistance transport/sequestration family protein